MYKNLPFFIVLFYKSMGSLVSIYQLYNIKLFNTLVVKSFIKNFYYQRAFNVLGQLKMLDILRASLALWSSKLSV